MHRLPFFLSLLLFGAVMLVGTSLVFGVDSVASANAKVAGSYMNSLANLTPDLETNPSVDLNPAAALVVQPPAGMQPVPQDKPDLTPANLKFATYTVRRGDTLTRIAAAHKTTLWALAKANNIRNINRIFVGQRLIVPGTGYFNWWQWNPAPQGVPVATFNPTLPSLVVHYPAVCNPLVNITTPLVNEEVNPTSVVIRGTANLPPEFDPGSSGFSYYKVEFGEGERPIIFHQIGSLHYNTVSNDVLETWDTSVLPNAVYILRLYAVSSRGNFPAPCEVRVGINRG